MEPTASKKHLVFMTVEAGETALSTRKLVIESAGYNCLSAVSGHQALRLAEIYPVHAVVLDADVTDIPPVEFIDSISRLCPNIPIYYLSHDGWTPPELSKRVKATLRKMGDPRELVQELAAAFPDRSEHSA
ncbi:MAG TPA: hypothetical protein VD837_16360 [Terriglobales bacterium]|nr:hypothetical protein [Terriglobales bacterium]